MSAILTDKDVELKMKNRRIKNLENLKEFNHIKGRV